MIHAHSSVDLVTIHVLNVMAVMIITVMLVILDVS